MPAVKLVSCFFCVFLLLTSTALAETREVCFYLDGNRRIGMAKDWRSIPGDFRVGSTCIGKSYLESAERIDPNAEVLFTLENGQLKIRLSNELPLNEREGGGIRIEDLFNFTATGSSGIMAPPDAIDLKGSVRQVEIPSALGPISLRWPRKVETMFGRTPERAMIEAANTVSRVLKQNGFPASLRTLNLNWNVVFMDERMPEQQIPAHLIKNCHPGWMTLPSNIYIVAQRVATGCSGRTADNRVSDAKLADVLLHEMGHVIESQILHERFNNDKMRAEGFATWFEMFAAKQSSLVNIADLERENKNLARLAIAASPNVFYFSGSAEDYARASLFFQAVVAKRGVKGLMDVYDSMRGETFIVAVKNYMHWNDKKMSDEIKRILDN